MSEILDYEKLNQLLKATNQLPASKRLIEWAIKCLAREGWDANTLQQSVDKMPVENRWSYLRPKLKDSYLNGLMMQLEKQLEVELQEKVRQSGYKVGDRCQYIGNDNLLVKLIKGKILTIKSFQCTGGSIWVTCEIANGLPQTILMDRLRKLYS